MIIRDSASITGWKRSMRCGPNSTACVEVATLTEAVAVRDSKQSHGPALAFGPAAWSRFVAQLRTGAFDLA
jgi:hypothetical protein